MGNSNYTSLPIQNQNHDEIISFFEGIFEKRGLNYKTSVLSTLLEDSNSIYKLFTSYTYGEKLIESIQETLSALQNSIRSTALYFNLVQTDDINFEKNFKALNDTLNHVSKEIIGHSYQDKQFENLCLIFFLEEVVIILKNRNSFSKEFVNRIYIPILFLEDKMNFSYITSDLELKLKPYLSSKLPFFAFLSLILAIYFTIDYQK